MEIVYGLSKLVKYSRLGRAIVLFLQQEWTEKWKKYFCIFPNSYIPNCFLLAFSRNKTWEYLDLSLQLLGYLGKKKLDMSVQT